jgi:hypothetical protein
MFQDEDDLDLRAVGLVLSLKLDVQVSDLIDELAKPLCGLTPLG